MLPDLELGAADIDRGAADMTEQYVGVPDDEFVLRITHRRRSIAATTRLMKQDRAVLCDDLFDELESCRCCRDFFFQQCLREEREMTDADESVRVGKSWENKASENQKKPSFLGL